MPIYDSTLNAAARDRIGEIKHADMVIGIPTHRNGRTIGEVLDAVVTSVQTYFPDRRVVLANADGGSSDNTVRQIEEAPLPVNVCPLLITYEGVTGKGTAIRAILEATTLLDSSVCVIVEARAPGITPEWIPMLATPVLQGDELVMGCYQRSAYAAALTDNLAYPFLRMFLNTDLREPLAPEFALSGDLAARLAEEDVWETDVSRFGVNVWIASYCLAEGLRISQVDLGYRGDGSGVPGAPFDARILHVFGTMFRLLSTHRHVWQAGPPARSIPFRGERRLADVVPENDCEDELIEAMLAGSERYGTEWEKTLCGETFLEVNALCQSRREAFVFPARLWARVALEFAIVHNEGEGDPDKVVEALLPLFYGRAATYIREARGLTLEERETLVESIRQAFEDTRPMFMELWNRSYTCLDDVSRLWV